MHMRRSLVPWLAIALVVLLIATIIVWKRMRGEHRTLAELALVKPRSDSDTLFTELSDLTRNLSRGSQRTQQNRAEREAWAAANTELLSGFDAWKLLPRSGPGFAPSARLADRNRQLTGFHGFDQPLDHYGDSYRLQRLSLLLAHDGRRELGNGNTETGMRRLHEAADVASLLLHNPDLIQAQLGGSVWAHLTEILEMDVPATHAAEIIARVPDAEAMRHAYSRAFFIEGLRLEIWLQRGSLGNGLMHGLSELAFNRDRTIDWNYVYFTETMAYLQGPLDAPPVTPPSGDWGDWIDNAVGKQMLGMSAPMYHHFFETLGVRIAMLDSIRARLHVRAEGSEIERATISAAVARLDLRNPFDGTLYLVGEDGRFILPRALGSDAVPDDLEELLFTLP